MIPTSTVRQDVARQLQAQTDRIAGLKAFVGLDGFVDEIYHVVDKRLDAERYERIPTIRAYGERLVAAAGRSTNVELVRIVTKLGGNGPIMANALAAMGVRLTYLGSLGYPNIHPVFEEFSRKASVHSIAEPGFTDALEFEDGKIIVGKHFTLKDVTWDHVVERFGQDTFVRTLLEADLVGFVNWTMLPYMSQIWTRIQEDVFPLLDGRRRRLFFDLADPEKRTAEDIRHALNLICRFQDRFDVILGLNEKEAYEVAQVLGLDPSPRSPEGLMALACQIKEQVPVDTLVVHPVKYALAVSSGDQASVEGPVCRVPRITTGAGDHFNSGFCLGKLLGLDNEASLLCGVCTSGHYVRHAASPTIPDLARLIAEWAGE